MNNSYKVAGAILFGTSTVHNDFSSIDLYGSAVQKKTENAICSVFHLENESGTGNIAVYQAFPGMELIIMICIWNTAIRRKIPKRE